jgi:hypothetical protein
MSSKKNLLQQLSISKQAITPLDWIKMHLKSVPSSFWGASILPQKLTMETAGSPDNLKKMYELTLMTSSASLEAILNTN